LTKPPVILRAEGLSKRYGAVQALLNFSFELRRGEVLALAGENGAGKSTAIGILGGSRQPDGGTIEVDGAPVTFADARGAHRAGIGVVYQEPMLVPQLDVASNVFLTLEPRMALVPVVRRSILDRRFAELSERTGISLAPRALVADLSVAQRQLVQVMRVVALGARIAILDEPTAALSPDDRDRLFELIGRMRAAADPTSFIVVSHFLEELERSCDRAIVLRSGQVVATLEERPTATELARLMGAQELERRRSPTRPSDRHLPSQAVPEKPLLSVSELRVGDGPPVSFDVGAGEILGIAGLVGSGRTELLRAVALGKDRQGGRVEIGGVCVNSPTEAVRAGLVMLGEDRRRGLIGDWPLWKNITLASMATTSSHGFTSKNRERQRAADLMERLRVSAPSPDVPVRALSGGNQQKVIFAKLIATNFQVALLDEPTHGVDVNVKADIVEMVHDLALDGRAFVIVAAELAELLAIATRVITLYKGGLVAEHQVTSDSPLPEELLLEAATGRPNLSLIEGAIRGRHYV
jgi:ribose transport system ATP-binding protein